MLFPCCLWCELIALPSLIAFAPRLPSIDLFGDACFLFLWLLHVALALDRFQFLPVIDATPLTIFPLFLLLLPLWISHFESGSLFIIRDSRIRLSFQPKLVAAYRLETVLTLLECLGKFTVLGIHNGFFFEWYPHLRNQSHCYKV